MGYQEKRGTSRQGREMPATLELGSEYFPVHILNLSSNGVMVDGVAGVPPGAAVSLEIGQVGWVEATVAWSMESRCGLAFVAPIDPELALAPYREPVA
jgi:hypothetical protein